MLYITHYESPLGRILLAADKTHLTGLWFENQKHYASTIKKEMVCKEQELPIFSDTKRWLSLYFSGIKPDFNIPIHFIGTDFQKEVWEILLTIPYGQTMTYGEIVQKIAVNRSCRHMSAQAVGGAVGRNPISILVPCHRVVGSNGQLIGYASGIEKKEYLLNLEQNFQL